MLPNGENEVFGVFGSALVLESVGIFDPGGDPGLFPNGEKEAFGVFEAGPVLFPNGANDLGGVPAEPFIGGREVLSSNSSLSPSDLTSSSSFSSSCS